MLHYCVGNVRSQISSFDFLHFFFLPHLPPLTANFLSTPAFSTYKSTTLRRDRPEVFAFFEHLNLDPGCLWYD